MFLKLTSDLRRTRWQFILDFYYEMKAETVDGNGREWHNISHVLL